MSDPSLRSVPAVTTQLQLAGLEPQALLAGFPERIGRWCLKWSCMSAQLLPVKLSKTRRCRPSQF